MDGKLKGRNGYAPCARRRPRPAPKPDFSVDSLFCAPVLAFASREPAPRPAPPQDRPIDLRQVGAFRKGLDQRPMLNSFVSPVSILSNCRTVRRGPGACHGIGCGVRTADRRGSGFVQARVKGIEDAPAIGTGFADQRRVDQTQQSRGMIGLGLVVVLALPSRLRRIL